MKLIFLRHCESEYNKDKTFPEKDCGLTHHGISQAVSLKGKFKPDVVVCSCMERCKQTLLHMNIAGVPVFYNDMCREYKQDICDYLKNESVIPENELQLLHRIGVFKDALKALSLKRDCDIVLVVTHADFIWYFTSHEVQGERFGTWIENGESLELSFP